MGRFRLEDRPVVLGQDGVKRYLRELETRLTQTFKDPRTGERTTYRRLMHDQARRLANTLSLHPSFEPVDVEPNLSSEQMGFDRAQLYQPFLVR